MENTGTKYCYKCGTQVAYDALFCSECGAWLSKGVQQKNRQGGFVIIMNEDSKWTERDREGADNVLDTLGMIKRARSIPAG